jgi:gas vesicle protein
MEDAMRRRRINWAETVSIFAIGVGVGAALGVLFAPQSGDDTRDYLIGSAKDGLDSAVATGQKWAKRAQDGFNDATDQVREQVRQATNVGERAYREAKNSSS